MYITCQIFQFKVAREVFEKGLDMFLLPTIACLGFLGEYDSFRLCLYEFRTLVSLNRSHQ